MAKKQAITFANWLQTGIIRISRIHFYLLGVFAIYIIASDATHLVTPDLVYQRWLAVGALLTVTGLVWYFSRAIGKNSNYYRTLLYALITADIAFAGFNVYTQRGMAARAVMLFAIPILVSGLLLSRAATTMVAILSTTVYILAAVKYFTDYFNEGYKAELYIETAFYAAIFFGLAAIISTLIRFKSAEADLGI